jgi:RHS repeat-associated protein
VRQQFTGHERDAETGLDFFGARYYSSVQGRFISYDPLWITAKRLVDPQQLNLYSYVRNNPLKYIDPDGMDLVLTAKDEEDVRKKFQIYLLGFKKEDRSHVHLVVGNGKNGFRKGQFGITVDAKHKSDSGNFQFAQKAANDHTALGKITVVKEGESYQIRETVFKNGKESFKISTNKLGPVDQEFEGYTFFQYRGKREEGIIYAKGVSEMVIHGGQDDEGIAGAMHHETRHLVLGDFGRTALRARHSQPRQPKAEADIETEKSDKESKENAKKP